MHFIESETDRHDRDDGKTTTKLMEKLFCFQVLIRKTLFTRRTTTFDTYHAFVLHNQSK